MTYIYHGIQDDFDGDELIPLNLMREKRLDLYEKYREKYKDREDTIEATIPLLNCSWNDVVQLLPFNPVKLFELQLEYDLIEVVPNYKYFQIDTDLLDVNKAVVYFKTTPGVENVTIKWLKDVDLNSLHSVPAATRDYYKSMIGTGKPVFNYQFVPHIVYKGSIGISKAKSVDISLTRID